MKKSLKRKVEVIEKKLQQNNIKELTATFLQKNLPATIMKTALQQALESIEIGLTAHNIAQKIKLQLTRMEKVQRRIEEKIDEGKFNRKDVSVWLNASRAVLQWLEFLCKLRGDIAEAKFNFAQLNINKKEEKEEPVTFETYIIRSYYGGGDIEDPKGETNHLELVNNCEDIEYYPTISS